MDIFKKKKEGELIGSSPEEEYRYYKKRFLSNKLYVKKILAEYPELYRLYKVRSSKMSFLKKKMKEHLLDDSIFRYLLCKKEGKCAVIVHRNGETSVRDSLSAVEKALGSREFIVADRGYLANIRHVMKMKSRELYMRNGNIITVGRERFKHVRKAILDYWKEI